MTSRSPARVLLVTSDREQCGIRAYGQMLQASVDPALAVVKEFPRPHPDHLMDALCQGCPEDALFPHEGLSGVWQKPEIIHVNHHAALHAGWKPEHVRAIRRLGYGVVVTQHDTFEQASIMWERGMVDFRGADYLIVHERVEGLGTGLYDAQPDFPRPGQRWGKVFTLRQPVPNEPVGFTVAEGAFHMSRKADGLRKRVLGLFGFDFPWKGFDMAVRAAKAAGWGVVVVSPGMSQERMLELQAQHTPLGVSFLTGWSTGVDEVVALLRRCDATAFLYSTGNSGTSSAIRAGIASRKPVIALKGCRQFRDLELDNGLGHDAILWADGEAVVTAHLRLLADSPQVYDYHVEKTTMLARMDSWKTAGNAYGLIYLELQDRLNREQGTGRRE